MFHMIWHFKEQETVFDQRPLTGLFFVDGDVYSRVLESETTSGMKYPKISFPSGLAYAVYERGANELWVHLFVSLRYPYFQIEKRPSLT